MACFFSALEKKVLIASMYFVINYSKSKNFSVDKVCLNRFEFACMTILSPETVSIVLCQCSIMDMQVPAVLNQPKTAEILAKTHKKCIKNAHRGNHKLKKFSGEIPPQPPLREGEYPLSRSPPLVP